MGRRAVFLDKDGTLVPNIPYNVDPALLELMPHCAVALREWSRAGYALVIVSNQPGVAHGYYPESALGPVKDRMRELFRAAGARLDGFYYCPHHPEGVAPAYTLRCDCRKPRPGLLKMAAADLELRLTDSWMIGDILNDVEAGNRAGCRTMLMDTGGEREWKRGPWRRPDFHVHDWSEVARIVGPESATAKRNSGGRYATRA